MHEWMPCEFCRMSNIREPCIKRWGPGREAHLFPLRAFPTSDDAMVDSGDGLLFHYIFSDSIYNKYRPCYLLRIAQMFRCGYGGIISSPTLRHGICALATFYLPSEQFADK